MLPFRQMAELRPRRLWYLAAWECARTATSVMARTQPRRVDDEQQRRRPCRSTPGPGTRRPAAVRWILRRLECHRLAARVSPPTPPPCNGPGRPCRRCSSTRRIPFVSREKRPHWRDSATAETPTLGFPLLHREAIPHSTAASVYGSAAHWSGFAGTATSKRYLTHVPAAPQAARPLMAFGGPIWPPERFHDAELRRGT